MYSRTIKIRGKFFTISYSARGYITINGNGVSVVVSMSDENKKKLTDIILWEREIYRLEREAISKVKSIMKTV